MKNNPAYQLNALLGKIRIFRSFSAPVELQPIQIPAGRRRYLRKPGKERTRP